MGSATAFREGRAQRLSFGINASTGHSLSVASPVTRVRFRDGASRIWTSDRLADVSELEKLCNVSRLSGSELERGVL